MNYRIILTMLICIVFATPAFALDVDLDSNDKMDTAYGGTNIDSSALTGEARVDAGVWSTVTKEYRLADLNDTTSPHVLLPSEIRNTIINLVDWTDAADITFVFPDISTGSPLEYRVKFINMQTVADPATYHWYIDVTTNDYIVLNKILMSQNEAVKNTTPAKYDSIVCHTAQSDTSDNHYLICDGINGIFDEETP